MPTPTRTQRGQSVTVWFALTVVALLAVAGLVVDGGAQTAATRRVTTAAQAAARAGVDAASTAELGGRPTPAAAQRAARAQLAAAGVDGSVDVVAGTVRVETRTTVPTTFLSIMGIGHLSARGSAEAVLRR